MTTDEGVIRGTAWLAMAGYFAGAFGLLRPRSWATRWVWAGACELYFFHIISAFHFVNN